MHTVEVVEEDLTMRILLSEWLASAGYVVRESSNLDQEQRPDVGAVVLSLRSSTPQLRETVQRAREMFPRAALVGISAQLPNTIAGESRKAMELGVSRLVSKPCTRAELTSAVAEAIQARIANGN